MHRIFIQEEKLMKGKLYILGAPMDIFSALKPELARRMVYLDSSMRFPKGLLKQVSRSLFVGRLPLKKDTLRRWFPKEDFDKLMTATSEDTILLYEWTNARVLKALMKLLPRETTWNIYYCNPIEAIFKYPREDLQKLARLGAKLWSFDPVDARRFGVGMAGQFFRYVETPPYSDVGAGRVPARNTAQPIPHSSFLIPHFQTDCFFCGLPKDRSSELAVLKLILERQGCTCDFIVPQNDEERISYNEYLERLNRTRCVVDLCQKMQTGLTRRPLEALFYGKKLITNNHLIKEYDFYNPKNVFIFGVDNTSRLGEFVKEPPEPVSEDVKRKYDVNGWVMQWIS